MGLRMAGSVLGSALLGGGLGVGGASLYQLLGDQLGTDPVQGYSDEEAAALALATLYGLGAGGITGSTLAAAPQVQGQGVMVGAPGQEAWVAGPEGVQAPRVRRR